MKSSEVIISIEGVEWGRAEFVYFKKLAKDREQIRLEGFTPTNALTLSADSEVILEVYFRGKLYWNYEFTPIDWEIGIGQSELSLYRDYPSRRFYHYGVGLHMLNRMVKGEKIDWRKLTRKGKKAYLKACLYWSGLPTQPVKSGDYEIDGSQIKIEVDFYCTLGEVFFGERGYFGQDLHGFNDCFSEIYMRDPNRPLVEADTRVTIRNKAQLEKVLNREYEEYYSMFVEDLKKYGLIVEFSQ